MGVQSGDSITRPAALAHLPPETHRVMLSLRIYLAISGLAPFAGFFLAGGIGSLFGTFVFAAALLIWVALEVTAPVATAENEDIEVAGLLTE